MTYRTDQDQTAWRTSSYSGNGDSCVEIGWGSGAALVRDSKDRHGGRLAVDTSAWSDLLRSVRPTSD